MNFPMEEVPTVIKCFRELVVLSPGVLCVFQQTYTKFKFSFFTLAPEKSPRQVLILKKRKIYDSINPSINFWSTKPCTQNRLALWLLIIALDTFLNIILWSLWLQLESFPWGVQFIIPSPAALLWSNGPRFLFPSLRKVPVPFCPVTFCTVFFNKPNSGSQQIVLF